MNKALWWRIGVTVVVIGVAMRITADPMRADGPRWLLPVNLGATVNSSSSEREVAITHSGLSLYFVSDRPGGFGMTAGPNGFGMMDIWVSHRLSVDAPWGEPRNLGPIINTPTAEFSPNFSPDDHWMFFPSGRPDGLGGLADIYVTYRLDTTDDLGWQTPVNLGPSVNSPKADVDPFYFVDPNTGEATLYFSSNLLGTFDIYQSTQNADGSFRNAVLNKELSTAAWNEQKMTIRSDGLEIIFVSNRPGGMGGLDLWVSTRNTTHDLWSEPVNLGPPVNTDVDDRSPSLSTDGLRLFFSSDRPGGSGNGDLWMTTRWPRQGWRWVPLMSRPSGQMTRPTATANLGDAGQLRRRGPVANHSQTRMGPVRPAERSSPRGAAGLWSPDRSVAMIGTPARVLGGKPRGDDLH